MNQTSNLEALEIVKERKCENSHDQYLSDHGLVKDIRVVLKYRNIHIHLKVFLTSVFY